MPITPDNTARADDFIYESEKDGTPANDEGRVPKLEEDAKLSPEFLHAIGAIKVTAGESITKGNALYLADNKYLNHIFTNVQEQLVSMGSGTSTFYISNVYTTPNIADKIFVKKLYTITQRGSASSGGTNYGDVIAYIYAVDVNNKPTGSPLFTSGLTTYSTWFTLDTEHVLTFASPAELTPNTKYAIVLKYTKTDTDVRDIKGDTTSPESSIPEYVDSHQSTDGTTWSDITGAYYLRIDWSFGTAGKVFKTNAKYRESSSFLGFAMKNASANDVIFAQIANRFESLSGLSVGSYYYLSDTSGAIATSAGTVSRKVAYADTTTSVVFNISGHNFNRYSIVAGETFPFDGFVYVGFSLADSSASYTIIDESGSTIAVLSCSISTTSETTSFTGLAPLYPVKKGWSMNKDCDLIDSIKII
jgi:hypothetical protein